MEEEKEREGERERKKEREREREKNKEFVMLLNKSLTRMTATKSTYKSEI